MNQEKIGKFIQERRKLKKLTQVELAEKLGVSNRTISKWENGNCMPDYSIFNALCKELDISINELLSGEKLNEDNYQNKLEENFVKTIDYNNKKQNKKVRTLIIFSLLVVIIYLFYKAFIAYVYYNNYTDFETKAFPNNKNIKTVKVKNNKMANQKVLDELYVYIPKEFELVTDKAKSVFVNDDCETYVKGLEESKDFEAMFLICNNYHSDLSNLDYYGIRSSLFPYMDVYKLLDKYNIHNSIDMIKFYERHADFKQSIFTKSDDIKINYIVRNYVNFTIPTYDKFYYLDEDLRGYLIENRSGDKYFNYAVLSYDNGLYNENRYSISFYNNKENYFDYDSSFEIVSSVIED